MVVKETVNIGEILKETEQIQILLNKIVTKHKLTKGLSTVWRDGKFSLVVCLPQLRGDL